MPGIYLTALLTSLLGIAALGTLIWQLAEKSDRRFLLALLIVGLPLSPLVFYAVRMPLDAWFKSTLGADSPWLVAMQLCYAPLTEEPAKLLPLVLIGLPAFRGKLTTKTVVPIALTLGLAFAVGEMWLVARFVAQRPELAGLPFYQFGGYVSERLQVCFTHAGFTALSVWGLARGPRWFALGLASGMVAHFLGNFPIYLMGIDWGGIGKPAWQILITLWVAGFTIGAVILLGVLQFGTVALKRFFRSHVRCPDCGGCYRQPIFGMNMGFKRYERCTLCGKWHWIDVRQVLRDPPD